MEKTISNWIKDNAHSGIKIELGFMQSNMDRPACMEITMIFIKFPMYFKNSPKVWDYIEFSNKSYIDYTDLSDEKIIKTLDSMYEQGSKQYKRINDEFGY